MQQPHSFGWRWHLRRTSSVIFSLIVAGASPQVWFSHCRSVVADEPEQGNILQIEIKTSGAPPTWALWQRLVLDAQYPAAEEFVAKYTLPDGRLRWRDEWPGFDGSDDGYESFYNFPLCYALGGDARFDGLSRKLWDGVTRQFTEYGQVHDEFDAHYDWMHHGESYVNFYFFGLCNPEDATFRARSVKFARLYTGENATAQNYDAELKLIRSPINGSLGPHFENTVEDWVTHRPILAGYPLPYDDIPHIRDSQDWNDDDRFPHILQAINERMMRGDVPLNLQATSLIANAYMVTGDGRYQQWIEEYVSAWIKRVEENGGILPDNVGLNGEIGQHMEGKWWGGYYGWQWPHGLFNQLEATIIGGSNAYLVSGDARYLDLPRSVIDSVIDRGREEKGSLLVPHRHGDDGWYDFRQMNANYPVHLWFMSREAEDWERLQRLSQPATWQLQAYRKGKGDSENALGWLAFLQGENPDYPEQILQATYQETLRRLQAIRADRTTPDEQDVHHWQKLNPVVLEGLAQLTLGAPNHIYHGGLLQASVRYFDPQERRPGIPADVALLVRRLTSTSVTLSLVNLHPSEPREVIVQGGMFGEHEIVRLRQVSQYPFQFHTGTSRYASIKLGPSAVGEVVLDMRRFATAPSYSTPWYKVGGK